MHQVEIGSFDFLILSIVVLFLGIANMTAVTGRFGPSPKAFLVVPLVGAFFIDIVNAAVIKFFIRGLTTFFG